MTEDLTNVAVGGILALLVLREVFNFIYRIRTGRNGLFSAPAAPPKPSVTAAAITSLQRSLDAIVVRMDRIVERLEDLNESTKASRKQSEITTEQTERMCRAVSQLEETMAELISRPWPPRKILTT